MRKIRGARTDFFPANAGPNAYCLDKRGSQLATAAATAKAELQEIENKFKEGKPILTSLTLEARNKRIRSEALMLARKKKAECKPSPRAIEDKPKTKTEDGAMVRQAASPK